MNVIFLFFNQKIENQRLIIDNINHTHPPKPEMSYQRKIQPCRSPHKRDGHCEKPNCPFDHSPCKFGDRCDNKFCQYHTADEKRTVVVHTIKAYKIRCAELAGFEIDRTKFAVELRSLMNLKSTIEWGFQKYRKSEDFTKFIIDCQEKMDLIHVRMCEIGCHIEFTSPHVLLKNVLNYVAMRFSDNAINTAFFKCKAILEKEIRIGKELWQGSGKKTFDEFNAEYEQFLRMEKAIEEKFEAFMKEQQRFQADYEQFLAAQPQHDEIFFDENCQQFVIIDGCELYV